MKLSEFKQDSYYFSGKASDISRHLAFAGIAIIWIFRAVNEDVPRIPAQLVFPTILFAVALAFDLLQYIVGTIIWSVFHRYHELKVEDGDDPEITAPPILNYPAWILFGVKIVLVFWSYIILIKFLISTWQQ